MSTNTNGNYNTTIGYLADVSTTSLTNATAIGAKAQANCNNCMVLGSVYGINSALSNIKVGIGKNAPATDLHIKQSNESYPVNGGGLRLERLVNTNHWDIGTDNGDDLDFVFNGVSKGYINHFTGKLVDVSDLRMKKDIQSLGVVLPAIMQLQAKTYHYKDNNNDAPFSYGFIAQEVEKLFPDFVTTKGADSMKAITYQNFSVLAIKGMQEQQKIIEGQQKQIDLLMAQNKMIMEEIEKLKKK
jgi:hypothetical protein